MFAIIYGSTIEKTSLRLKNVALKVSMKVFPLNQVKEQTNTNSDKTNAIG